MEREKVASPRGLIFVQISVQVDTEEHIFFGAHVPSPRVMHYFFALVTPPKLLGARTAQHVPHTALPREVSHHTTPPFFWNETMADIAVALPADGTDLAKPTTERQDTADTEATTLSTASSTQPDTETRSDEELIAEGTRLCLDDQILPGAALLRRVKDTSLLTDDQKEFLRRGDVMEKLRDDLFAPTSEGWTKQGESHGDRDFIVYYKTEDGGKLKCRIESVIESSLYVPFLAVMYVKIRNIVVGSDFVGLDRYMN